MVTTELLRRYPYFGGASPAALKNIAAIAEERQYAEGVEIFEECGEANTLFLLLEGGVELYFSSQEEYYPKSKKEFHVGEINPGEVFGVSSLIEPYALNTTARVSQKCRVIAIDAVQLREMFTKDPGLGYQIMLQTVKVVVERLGYVRVQLAAASSA